VIAPPQGWSVSSCDGSLVLVPPEGPTLGLLRYLERVRPLRAASAVIAALPAPAGWVERERTPIERLITSEGEYAAFAAISGTIDEQPADRTFGLVFGDDFYARLTGICFDPARFAAFRATVRQLLFLDAHILGTRRRRFRYTPPAGWHGLADLFDATWYPMDHPRRDLVLTVSPAVPLMPGLHEGLIVTTAGTTSIEDGVLIDQPEEIALPLGPHGRRLRLRTRAGRETTLVLLEDDVYLYCVRCDCADAHADEARRVVDDLLASLEPVPRPGAAGAQAAQIMMRSWTE